MATIYPSLISADLLNLETQIHQLDPYCHGYHLDVMDFHFTPNLTWGPPFINQIAHTTTRQLWVHLMVEKPTTMIDALKLPANSILTFHIETSEEKNNLISRIKGNKWLPGIAISPKTSIQETIPFLATIHQVTIMSVEPGFSGQTFLPNSLAKIKELADYRAAHKLSFRIGVDGGINEENIKMVVDTGADDLACAAAIFSHDNPVERLRRLHERVRS